ncbi:hypothetical protein HHL17_08880 [Chitinophaga sp. G-6-1-13]|uniref:Secretin/TonB short N-terminal domain-containing protein n=1 Tax=Chitinophaga fulva TaxID=2728842 RepID=A0A848GHW9_9BACT|nr:STN domain-containing protein [Chitinophaga fulva]NML37311.1 hypothetical protein [Chitinophaga fulva]
MKRTVTKIWFQILLMAFGVFYARSLQAQHSSPEAEYVTICTSEIRFNKLFELLHAQTGAHFSINTSKFPSTKIIRLNAGRYTLKQVLIQLRNHTGIEYKKVDKYIVITDGTVPKKRAIICHKNSPAKTTCLLHHLSLSNLPYTSHLTYNPAGVQLPVIIVDSGSMNAVRLDKGLKQEHLRESDTLRSIATRHSFLVDSVKKQTGEVLKVNLPSIPIHPFYAHSSAGYPYIALGWYADENSLLNVEVNGGFQHLYLVAAVSRNNGFELFRYGLGSKVGLDKHYDLNVSATYGINQKKYSDLNDTSKSNQVTVKGKFLQARLNLERHINDHWSLQAGISINALFQTYYYNDIPAAPMLDEQHYFAAYKIVHTPVILGDSYSSQKSISFISWMGFQFGISYTINSFHKRPKKGCPKPDQ